MINKRFWIFSTLTECSGIKDKDKLLTFDEVVDLLNEQHEENTRLKQTIQEAYETERTQIGKNTLKQLIQSLE